MAPQLLRLLAQVPQASQIFTKFLAYHIKIYSST